MCKKNGNAKGIVLYLTIGILTLAPVVHAQAVNITGTVVDSATSAEIANALVRLVEVPGCTTRTNASGAFTLATTVSTAAAPTRTHTNGSLTFAENSVAIAGLPGIENVVIAGFALDGARLFNIESVVNGAGEIALPGLSRRHGVCLVTVFVAGKKYSVFSTGSQSVTVSIDLPKTGALQKTAATYSVQVAANTYRSKTVTGISEQGGTGTIRLAKDNAQVGVWTNVTPSDMNLNGVQSLAGGNYGSCDLIADPVRPGFLYAFACYQGCWRSTDYGQTWVKFHAGTDFLSAYPDIVTTGRPVGNAIAKDGSYMIVAQIYPAFPPNAAADWKYRSNIGWDCLWISRENGPDSALGKYWELSQVGVVKPCRVAIDPEDKNHIVTSVSTFELMESIDAGRTWTNRGAILPEATCDLVFINAHQMLVGVPNDGGTYRADRTGAWPWTWTLTKISNQSAGHTMWIPIIDTVSNHLYFPGSGGITRSTDLMGTTWATIANFGPVRTLVTTPTRMYAGDEFPTDGTHNANLRHCTRTNETVWTPHTIPAGMTNGPVYMKSVFDGTHWVLVSCNWLAGLWRYIEP